MNKYCNENADVKNTRITLQKSFRPVVIHAAAVQKYDVNRRLLCHRVATLDMLEKFSKDGTFFLSESAIVYTIYVSS